MPEERLQKILSQAGVASRRQAEVLIVEGRVTVNGKTITELGSKADLDRDHVKVDGHLLRAPKRLVYIVLYKPNNTVTTVTDPEGRTTVMELLRGVKERVYPVGRLDYHSEGLLLLTNDGALARRLELPSTGWVRRYRVRVHGEVDVKRLAALENGITVEGVRYGSIKAVLDRQQGSNAWLTVSLQEGKNREIRRVFDALGWPVTRLIRVAYGPFQLGNLPEGAAEEVPGKVVKEQLGGARPKPPARPESAAKPAGATKHAHRRRPA